MVKQAPLAGCDIPEIRERKNIPDFRDCAALLSALICGFKVMSMSTKLTSPAPHHIYRLQINSAKRQLEGLNRQIASLNAQMSKTELIAELAQRLKALELERRITENEIEHIETQFNTGEARLEPMGQER